MKSPRCPKECADSVVYVEAGHAATTKSLARIAASAVAPKGFLLDGGFTLSPSASVTSHALPASPTETLSRNLYIHAQPGGQHIHARRPSESHVIQIERKLPKTKGVSRV